MMLATSTRVAYLHDVECSRIMAHCKDYLSNFHETEKMNCSYNALKFPAHAEFTDTEALQHAGIRGGIVSDVCFNRIVVINQK